MTIFLQNYLLEFESLPDICCGMARRSSRSGKKNPRPKLSLDGALSGFLLVFNPDPDPDPDLYPDPDL